MYLLPCKMLMLWQPASFKKFKWSILNEYWNVATHYGNFYQTHPPPTIIYVFQASNNTKRLN